MNIPECSVACQHVFERAFFYFGVASATYLVYLVVQAWVKRMTHWDEKRRQRMEDEAGVETAEVFEFWGSNGRIENNRLRYTNRPALYDQEREADHA